MHHSHLKATSQDPKNPDWYVSFGRRYKGECYTSYVPHGVGWEEDPIQESIADISWMDWDKKFSLSIGSNTFFRK